jgi:hypothetical protein
MSVRLSLHTFNLQDAISMSDIPECQNKFTNVGAPGRETWDELDCDGHTNIRPEQAKRLNS